MTRDEGGRIVWETWNRYLVENIALSDHPWEILESWEREGCYRIFDAVRDALVKEDRLIAERMVAITKKYGSYGMTRLLHEFDTLICELRGHDFIASGTRPNHLFCRRCGTYEPTETPAIDAAQPPRECPQCTNGIVAFDEAGGRSQKCPVCGGTGRRLSAPLQPG